MVGRVTPQLPPANHIPRQSVSNWRQCRGGTSYAGLGLQDYNSVRDDDDDEDSDGGDARNLKQIILILLDYKGSLSET